MYFCSSLTIRSLTTRASYLIVNQFTLYDISYRYSHWTWRTSFSKFTFRTLGKQQKTRVNSDVTQPLVAPCQSAIRRPPLLRFMVWWLPLYIAGWFTLSKFWDYSTNFVRVNSKFWGNCKKCFMDWLNVKYCVSSLKHFLQILQDLEFTNAETLIVYKAALSKRWTKFRTISNPWHKQYCKLFDHIFFYPTCSPFFPGGPIYPNSP